MVVYASNRIKSRGDAYELLAHGASAQWGMDKLPDLERSGDGKPFFTQSSLCHFNLSHSEPYALCALDDAPVGVDIQVVRNRWREGLPKRVCSETELAWLDAQSDRWRAFALLWALKEAKVKYTGTGLRVGIREISVPLPEPDRTLYRHDGLWFRIYSGLDWQAAVCGEHRPPEKLIWK